ncbi:MAG: hypothetical protein WC554_15890, partial [Clostridia bacterium]
MKLLVLILGARSGQYNDIVNNSLKTWAKSNNPNITVYPYYGNHNKTEIINNELLINTADNNITLKTVEAYDYAVKNLEFDYLIRFGASIFGRLDKVYEHFLNTSRKNYHGGYKLNHAGITYSSGMYVSYSRDIVEKIAKDKAIINDNQWADDWVIGKYLQNIGCTLTETFEYYSLIGEWPEIELINKMFKTPKEELEKYTYFRCKTEILNKDKILPLA